MLLEAIKQANEVFSERTQPVIWHSRYNICRLPSTNTKRNWIRFLYMSSMLEFPSEIVDMRVHRHLLGTVPGLEP